MMQPSQQNKTTSKKTVITLAVYASILLALFFLTHLESLHGFFDKIFALVRPIVWGLILSYFVNPFFRFFERRAFSKIRHLELRRFFALTLSYLALFLLVGLLIAILIPQLIAALSNFFTNLGGYIDGAIESYNSIVQNLNNRLASVGIHQNILKPTDMTSLDFSIGKLLEKSDEIMKWAEALLTENGKFSLIGMISNLFAVITDLIFALFVSIYFLASKEKRHAQIMKMRHALFNNQVNAFITRVCTVANRCFGNFILGKLAESVLISIAAYLVFLLFNVPYAILIAVIGGISNMIPFVGPVIGAIPALVIMLLAAPEKTITMLLIIFVIQQLDKNLINPRMFDQYSISSLAIVIAVTTVGFSFGLGGLLVCVPLFATLTALLDRDIEQRLRRKGMLSATENYYPADSIVDPAKDSRKMSDTTIQRFEKSVFEILVKQEKGETLTKSEKNKLSAYRFLVRNSIISEMSNDIRMRFAAESVEKNTDIETEQLIRQMHGLDLIEKQSESQ